MKLFCNLKGDFLGGLASSVLSMPSSVGFGILIFSQIGTHYSVQGAFAGLCGGIFSVIISSLVGGTPAQITAPSAASTAILMSFVVTLMGLGVDPAVSEANMTTLLGWLFFTIIFAGVIQFLFGVFKLGQLTKYVPYSVVIGFLNGIGLILIIKQLQSFLGFQPGDSFTYIFDHLSSIQPATVCVGIITLLIVFNSDRFTKKIPAPLFTLVVGTLFYYLFHYLFSGAPMGAVVGGKGSTVPQLEGLFTSFSLAYTVDDPNFSSILSLSLITAFTLAFVGSLQSLLSSLAVDIITGTRHKSNRELIGQGLGNIVSGLFGGIHCAALPPITLLNIKSGGKTRLSGIFCGILMLFYLLVGWSVIALIPYVVLGGIIMYYGYMLIEKDSWVELFKQNRQYKLHKDFYLGLAVTSLVTVATLVFSISIAIFIGMVLSILIYLQQASVSVIRNQFHMDQIRSRVRRSPQLQKILLERGKECVILHLQGSLFFASAGNLSDAVEEALKDASYAILDMRHLAYCDATSLRVLQRLYVVIKNQKKFLLFSNVKSNKSIEHLMQTVGMLGVVEKEHIFESTDLAMEWVENKILLDYEQPSKDPKKILEESFLFDSLGAEEKHYLESMFMQKTFKAGSCIFKENDKRKDLYILQSGQISIYSKLKGSKKTPLRIIGLFPGAIFGEIAFLLGNDRSAEAIAQTDCHVMIFPQELLTIIIADHPLLAFKISKNLSANMAYYMQHMLDELIALESP